MLTKSGTNALHGSLFEFVRNTLFNANDWGSQLDRAPLHRNQFGATLGGPIKRDKTFFAYSGLRQTTSTFLNNAIVPTDLERTGSFSASRTLPTDPATGKTLVCNGVTGVICPDRLDPVARRNTAKHGSSTGRGTCRRWRTSRSTPSTRDSRSTRSTRSSRR